MSFLELVTVFRNKVKDLFDGASLAWDWMDPPLRSWGDWSRTGYVLNKDWPTEPRAHRERCDVNTPPEKAYRLSMGIWEAYQVYLQTIRLDRDKEKAWRRGVLYLEHIVRQRGAGWEPALHAWKNKALSPLSMDWGKKYKPALDYVIHRWGSITTPGSKTDLARGIKRQFKSVAANHKGCRS